MLKAILVATLLNLSLTVGAIWWAYHAWEAAESAAESADIAKSYCEYAAD